jgi:hypothetical protein
VVLRLLRGEGREARSRDRAGGPHDRRLARRLPGRRARGLKTRLAPVEDRRPADAQRKIGELSMDLDIARALLEEVERRPGSPGR